MKKVNNRLITLTILFSLLVLQSLILSKTSYANVYEVVEGQVVCLEEIVEEADPATFIQLGEKLNKGYGGYGKDQNHVYYFCEILEGADPSSFTILTNNHSFAAGYSVYAKDQNHVYFRGEILEEADASTFQVYGITAYAEYTSDKNHIFFKGEIIEGADPNNFRFLCNDTYFLADGNNVFHKKEILDQLDPMTTGMLFGNTAYGGQRNYHGAYLKDKNGVYFNNQKLEHVDGDSLERLGEGYWKDQNNIYSKGLKQEHIIEEADPESFQILWNYEVGPAAEDINNIYHRGEVYKKNDSGLALFADIKNSNYYDSIQTLAKMNIIEGEDFSFLGCFGNEYIEIKRFYPFEKINRAELMKITIEYFYPEIDEKKYSNCFLDVKDQWFAKYICFAKEKGFIHGYPDGTFRPEQPVNYAEALKIIYETAKYPVEYISDGKEWYTSYINDTKKRGIAITNTPKLDHEITREEAAELLNRFLQKNKVR